MRKVNSFVPCGTAVLRSFFSRRRGRILFPPIFLPLLLASILSSLAWGQKTSPDKDKIPEYVKHRDLDRRTFYLDTLVDGLTQVLEPDIIGEMADEVGMAIGGTRDLSERIGFYTNLIGNTLAVAKTIEMVYTAQIYPDSPVNSLNVLVVTIQGGIRAVDHLATMFGPAGILLSKPLIAWLKFYQAGLEFAIGKLHQIGEDLGRLNKLAVELGEVDFLVYPGAAAYSEAATTLIALRQYQPHYGKMAQHLRDLANQLEIHKTNFIDFHTRVFPGWMEKVAAEVDGQIQAQKYHPDTLDILKLEAEKDLETYGNYLTSIDIQDYTDEIDRILVCARDNAQAGVEAMERLQAARPKLEEVERIIEGSSRLEGPYSTVRLSWLHDQQRVTELRRAYDEAWLRLSRDTPPLISADSYPSKAFQEAVEARQPAEAIYVANEIDAQYEKMQNWLDVAAALVTISPVGGSIVVPEIIQTPHAAEEVELCLLNPLGQPLEGKPVYFRGKGGVRTDGYRGETDAAGRIHFKVLLRPGVENELAGSWIEVDATSGGHTVQEFISLIRREDAQEPPESVEESPQAAGETYAISPRTGHPELAADSWAATCFGLPRQTSLTVMAAKVRFVRQVEKRFDPVVDDTIVVVVFRSEKLPSKAEIAKVQVEPENIVKITPESIQGLHAGTAVITASLPGIVTPLKEVFTAEEYHNLQRGELSTEIAISVAGIYDFKVIRVGKDPITEPPLKELDFFSSMGRAGYMRRWTMEGGDPESVWLQPYARVIRPLAGWTSGDWAPVYHPVRQRGFRRHPLNLREEYKNPDIYSFEAKTPDWGGPTSYLMGRRSPGKGELLISLVGDAGQRVAPQEIAITANRVKLEGALEGTGERLEWLEFLPVEEDVLVTLAVEGGANMAEYYCEWDTEDSYRPEHRSRHGSIIHPRILARRSFFSKERDGRWVTRTRLRYPASACAKTPEGYLHVEPRDTAVFLHAQLKPYRGESKPSHQLSALVVAAGPPRIQHVYLKGKRPSDPGAPAIVASLDVFYPSDPVYVPHFRLGARLGETLVKGDLSISLARMQLSGDQELFGRNPPHSSGYLVSTGDHNWWRRGFPGRRGEIRPGKMTLRAYIDAHDFSQGSYSSRPVRIAKGRDRLYSRNKVDLTLNQMTLRVLGLGEDHLFGYALSIQGPADMIDYVAEWHFEEGREPVETLFAREDEDRWVTRVPATETLKDVYLKNNLGRIAARFAGTMETPRHPLVVLTLPPKAPIGKPVEVTARIEELTDEIGTPLGEAEKYYCRWWVDPSLGVLQERQTGFLMDEEGHWISRNTLTAHADRSNVGTPLHVDVEVMGK